MGKIMLFSIFMRSYINFVDVVNSSTFRRNFVKIKCIVHADFESPGVIQEWALQNQHSFQIVKPYKGENCLMDSEFDCLIIMGGPQSPLELEKDIYLLDEILLIKQAIADGKHVLGFCLGAQLIGESLGAETSKSPHKEVGVFPITLTEEGKKDPLFSGMPEIFPVIHWHNDMPGGTKDSVLLAVSEGCSKQAYRYGARVYGLQFHLEITLDGIKGMIDNCPNDLVGGGYTQTREQLLKQDYDSINKRMCELLDRFVEL